MIVTFQTQLKGVTRKAGTFGQHVVKVTLNTKPDYKADVEHDLKALNALQAQGATLRAETDAILTAQGFAPCGDDEWNTAFMGDRKKSKGLIEALVLSANDAQDAPSWGTKVVHNNVTFTEHNGNFYLKGFKVASSIVVKDTDAPAPNKRRATSVKDALKQVINSRVRLRTASYRTYRITDLNSVTPL